MARSESRGFLSILSQAWFWTWGIVSMLLVTAVLVYAGNTESYGMIASLVVGGMLALWLRKGLLG